MIALNLIDKEITPLHGEESVASVLALLQKYDLTELPVVSKNRYKGMLTLSDLQNAPTQELSVSQIRLQNFESVEQQCHFFEIWSRLVEAHLSCIAVTSEDNEYLGCIRQRDLLQFYKQTFALTEPGCIIVLSQRKRDYSMARIATIVEEHDSVILGSFVTETSDPENILITVKLNQTEPETIMKSLQRFDIDVIDVFSEETFSDLHKDRFNMLMSYLNL